MIKGYYLNDADKPKTIYFDKLEELPELEEYAAENNLCMGSVAVCCADGSEYLLDSLGKWNKKGGNV